MPSISFNRDPHMARMLQVRENIVRSRLDCGGPLTAREIADGVRLSFEEFLWLCEKARLSRQPVS